MTKAKLIRRHIPDLSIVGAEHLHPLIKRLYLARGITQSEEIEYRLNNLLRPHGFSGLSVAAELVIAAIKSQQRIVIVGDFDADGATSTAMVLRCLAQMGAKHLDFIVPNRFEYGYGLTAELVDELIKIKADLVITVDNGISSFDGVTKARKMGMSVIITDHHLPPETLPPAHAIVNPSCEGDEFPSKALAGVGVAFYLLSAIRTQLIKEHWFEANHLAVPNLAHVLDLVALGTVADLVPLDANNRILVDAGLQRIKSKNCCVGISALCDVASVDQSNADSSALAFYIAPRLNAAGRLEDMSIGINLLTTDDPGEARQLAAQLHDINQQRKQIQAEMQTFADSVVQELKKQTEFPQAICMYHKNWHQGVVGLLASKVKEFTHRPVIAFANENAESHWIKGSARSIKGLHIRDVLVAIDANSPGLIKKFGGHAMAAGLTMDRAHLAQFKQQFAHQVSTQLTAGDLDEVILTDGPVDVEDLTLHMAEMIQNAGPWGQQFEPPVFDGWFIIKDKKLIGENHTKLTLQTPDLSKRIAGIAFNCHPNQFSEIDTSMQLCFQMMVNEFRNRRSLQLRIDHIL